jgi:hypothetical protein
MEKYAPSRKNTNFRYLKDDDGFVARYAIITALSEYLVDLWNRLPTLPFNLLEYFAPIQRQISM